MSHQESVPNLDNARSGTKSGKRRRQGGNQERGQRDVSKMIAAAREKILVRRWKEAAAMLKRVLAADRSNAVATALLGLTYLHQHKIVDGQKLMKRALEVAPMEPLVHILYGRLLHGAGQIDQAVNSFTRALQLDPNNGEAYRELAVLLIDAGVLDQAMEALIMAIKMDPRDSAAFYHLGLIKKMQGHDGEAIDAYSMAVAIRPNYAEAHVNLAKIAIDHRKYELGEKSCRRAIEADPSLGQAYINLGMVKREQKQLEEALRYAKKGAELEPLSGAAHSNLGNVYMDMQRYKDALACFRKAMEFQPSFATSYFNYGNALRLLHVLDKANESYEKAILLDASRGEYHHNQGLVLQEQGEQAKALEKFRLGHKLSPDHLGLEFSLSRSLWRNGLLEESWKHFDAGLAGDLRKPNRRFRVPRWGGEEIAGKRIFVWREQGVGDEINFSRRYQHIIDAAGEAVFEVDPRLLPLFERTFPQGKFLPERLDAKNDWERQDCDLHLPAGNLMQYFPYTQEELGLATYPEDDVEAAFLCGERSKEAKGYLVPDPDRVSEMAERVAQLPDGLRVGICWCSQFSHRDRDIHYTKLEMWEPFFRIPGITFVNVHYDKVEAELQEVEQAFGVKIHRWSDIDLKKDLEAAFALTSQLDMVISTSASPRRIGDAVGKEVWLMKAAGSQPRQPVVGEYGAKSNMTWQRHWTEPWPVLIERMARALEARLKG
ncbi:MAG: tetratricopeptide repeat protein [Kiloniellaceae bacterium]